MSETWMDVARETMTEDEVHDLLVGVEQEVHDDPDAAIERAYEDVSRHFEHVVVLAWNTDGDLLAVGENIEDAAVMLRHAQRFDERLRPLRAHLGERS